ncbi:hypothetical protein [Parvularcula sp. LCG005]|uniref:hypothetical protein n=1 Tax=Parvularcula sp. LCG005 TaxID=3078805 RepID=UPI0029436269|nr:hypothetical protein [Parvularcula sp. LCG005]WOI52330.1 hypothetical protein RUI03_09215 [Parvularcula sp. LCG005]
MKDGTVTAPAKVLIVEDEPIIGADLCQMVAELGHEAVGPFASAEEAIDVIAISCPSIALLDVNLTDGTTSEAVADALAERGIPFAFMTGSVDPVVSRQASPYQCAVVMKPVGGDVVEILVEELIARRRQLRTLVA